MTVGDKIKQLRKSMGLNQTELGEKVGVKKNAVSKWECGRVEDIPTSTIKALANLFNVSPSYLIDEEKEQPTVSDGLSADRQAMLDFINSLSDEQVRRLLQIAHAAFGTKNEPLESSMFPIQPLYSERSRNLPLSEPKVIPGPDGPIMLGLADSNTKNDP